MTDYPFAGCAMMLTEVLHESFPIYVGSFVEVGGDRYEVTWISEDRKRVGLGIPVPSDLS